MDTGTRVGIFVDAQNIYHSAKNLHNSRVSFAELKRAVLSGRTCVRAFAYVVKSEGIGLTAQAGADAHRDDERTGEESFFEAFRAAGFELRLKDIQIYPGGQKKADWDVGMAIDAVRTAPSFDVAILVTGDGDFIPLVEYLKWGLGKRVEVAGFSRTTSGKLREAADAFKELEKVPKLLISIRGRRGGGDRKRSDNRGNKYK